MSRQIQEGAAMTHPPQGWYADPESAHQFRYWDGSGWTQHVAPSGPAATTAPRVWTKATAATLISCLLLVVAATAGSAELVRRAHAEIDAEPVRILEGFLGSAVRGDRGWEAFAAPRIVDEVALSNPLRSEERRVGQEGRAGGGPDQYERSRVKDRARRAHAGG